MYVCILGVGDGRQLWEDENLSLAEGAGLERATLGWDLPESLNHIGAAMGRLPGAWRTEREAQAVIYRLLLLLISLLPWRDSLLHTWAAAGGLARGSPLAWDPGSFFLWLGLAGPYFPDHVTEWPGSAMSQVL